MQVANFGFSDIPDDLETDLRLFMAEPGSYPRDNSVVFPQFRHKSEVYEGTQLFLTGLGYQEMGALKDDLLIQVAKGLIKTNYGNSKKKECNFTLLYAIGGGGSTPGDNIGNTIYADGCIQDIMVLDLANCLTYELRDLELETGVKIQHKKFTELSFKALGDGFRDHLKVHYMITIRDILQK